MDGLTARLSRVTRNHLLAGGVVGLVTLDLLGWGLNGSASAALPSIAASAPSASASTSSGAFGSLPSLLASAPSAAAASSSAASGQLPAVTISPPSATATAGAQFVPALWSISCADHNAAFSAKARNSAFTGAARNAALSASDHTLFAASVMRGPDFGGPMAIIGTMHKQPIETLLIECDFSAHVGTRSLTSMTVVPTIPAGLTLADSAQSGAIYQMWVGGGSDMVTYKISLTVTFVIAGHTEITQDEVMILVEEV